MFVYELNLVKNWEGIMRTIQDKEWFWMAFLLISWRYFRDSPPVAVNISWDYSKQAADILNLKWFRKKKLKYKLWRRRIQNRYCLSEEWRKLKTAKCEAVYQAFVLTVSRDFFCQSTLKFARLVVQLIFAWCLRKFRINDWFNK